jgi:hypothetical protein
MFDVILTPEAFPGDAVRPLAEAIARAEAGGTRTILAQLSSRQGPPLVCPDGSERMAGRQHPVLACAASAVAPVAWRADHRAGFYPLYVATGEGAATRIDPSPAWAVYLALSGRTGADQAPRGREAADDLFLAWGSGEPERGRCLADTEDPRRVWYVAFARAFCAILHPGDSGNDKACTYLPRRSVAALAGPASAAETALIRDRSVFIGLGFTGSNDLIAPPQGGQIPAVFLHATALDNLLTLGVEGHFAFSRPELEFLGTDGLLGADTAFGGIALLLGILVRRVRAPPPAGFVRYPIGVAVYLAGAVLQALPLLGLLAPALGLALPNALATLFICLLIEPLSDFVSEHVKGKGSNEAS